MIGSLMYLVTCTRPDLDFSISFLSCFSSHPLLCYYTAVKRVFCYLSGTQHLSLKYSQSTTSVPLHLSAFSDADYASCCDPNCCVSGFSCAAYLASQSHMFCLHILVSITLFHSRLACIPFFLLRISLYYFLI